MRVKLFPSILVCLLCVLGVGAQVIDEAGSTATINATNAEILLAASNTLRAFEAHAELQLIDPAGSVRASVSQSLGIKHGKHKYRILIPLGDLAKTQGDDLAWFRIKYRVGAARGTVSLSELLKDAFELRLSATDQVVPGTDYRVRVRAINPFTKTNVRRVSIDAKLAFDIVTDSDEDEVKLSATATTNGDGLAILNFKIPPGVRLDGEPEIEIAGRKNGVVRKIEEDVESTETTLPVFFTTDKPMYQPGETFNLRGLFLDVNNTVVSGKEFELSIEDEDDTGLFRQTVTTSEFGIASISWKIPASAKLGTYQVELDGDEYFTFKVSRYDLPNFVVTAEADKKFYLTTDRLANITVAADYLFGKPVTRGKVRVVQETERKWNWKEQKYEADEGSEVEGETNGEGKYVAAIDLAEEMKKLEDSQWLRFQDLHFAAYFTDPSTNRTEQKRFDVRITKDPIHVYLIYYADQNPRLPMLAYVSTFYADGTPAVCSIDVSSKNSTLYSLKTNALGAGKIKFSIPEDAVNDRKFNLKVAARDKHGRRGIFHEDLSLNDHDAVQLETDKAVYKAGDLVRVDLTSTQERGIVYVDLIKDRVVIESRHANLRSGKAELQFLSDSRFKGALTIAAYTDTNSRSWDPQMRFSRGIIFPEKQDIRLDAKFSRKTFRPGEDANVRFSVSGVTGRTAESALGITIFDRAIEERARTDGEFRNYFGGFASLMGLDRAYGNITLKDLNALDVSKPVSDEMQLAAEVILAPSYHRTNVYHSRFDAEDVHTIYSDFFKKQTQSLELILRQRFDKDHTYPADEESLRGILRMGGGDLASFQDPWGKTYSPVFQIDRSHIVLSLVCSGPDKTIDTPDDFVVLTSRFPYFAKIAGVIDRAVTDEYFATGRHVRDVARLNEVLRQRGVDPLVLTDPWKRPYLVSFEAAGRHYVIRISSLGADGVKAATRWGGDDFDVANIYTDYFAKTESEINVILSRAVGGGKRKFPADTSEFKAMLRDGGLDVDALHDGNGGGVYVMQEMRKQYVVKEVVENGRTVSRSVGLDMPAFILRTTGENKGDSSDDRELASFSRIATELYGAASSAGRARITSIVTGSAKGAIRGTLTDPNGAVIPGMEVTAFEQTDEKTIFIAESDVEGNFLLANLPSGKYTVTVPGRYGFTTYRQENVVVRSQTLVEMNIALNVAGATATVDVVAAASEMDQTTNSTGTNISTRGSSGAKIVFPYLEQTSTPRLREYFPETLLWQPELLTDRSGKAELNFKLADNITTWKMYAIASTKAGKVAVAEKEFTAFQAFFVDLDPPKFLTEGDRISLPVQVRNYTEEKQAVDVSMAKSDWFSFTAGDRQMLDVEPGGSKNAIFRFKADMPVTLGKQRVTATAKKDADAIEKSVTVRPNGKEIVQMQSSLFHGTETFKLDFPTSALPGTPRAEAKIYPNLFSHVGESVEGLLKRPYGCGEQTISSTYPNVMILKFVKADTALRRKAQEYLRTGYDRLIGYQVADGGFTYWGGKDTSNIALTAYALRFLNDAKEFVDVDQEVIRRAEDYLVRMQNADGSWPGRYSYGGKDAGPTLMSTAYVVRSLASPKAVDKSAGIQKAFAYLDTHLSEMTDSYTLALFGLALLDAGDAARAKTLAERLQKSGVADGSTTYWDLESSTLFYGWGSTGRIETTALVAQLLTRTLGADASANGTLYLLKNKDRYGVWYSTQTTINVLDALLVTIGAKHEMTEQTVQVFLNGESLQSVPIDGTGPMPVTIDLGGRLNGSSNTFEIRGAGRSPLMAQIVGTHYIAWKDVPPDRQSDLRLGYRCDKTDVAIMSEITCSVETGRNTSRGYGMLLAEIGLPPGADVSRESLERAMQGDAGVSRYDILPDRIIVYLWSRPGGTKFEFRFRPRYGIDARTPPSLVYDYYNPESQTTIAPLRFSVN